MNKIYVIVSGQYSDWNLEGYETDREKAELICYHHNQLPDSEKDWLYGNWYVMPLEKFDHETGDHNIYWTYKIRIEYRNNEYVIDDYIEENYVTCDKKAIMPVVENHSRGSGFYICRWSNKRFLSFEEAKKIAIDMLMQWLAAEMLG